MIAKHVAFAVIALGVGLTVGLAWAWPSLLKPQYDGTFGGPCLCEYREIGGREIGRILSEMFPYQRYRVSFACLAPTFNAGVSGPTQYNQRYDLDVARKKEIDWPQCRTSEVFANYWRAVGFALGAAVLVFAALLALSKSRRKRNSQE